MTPTGGAHGKLPQTTKILSHVSWRGGRVADYGKGAAGIAVHESGLGTKRRRVLRAQTGTAGYARVRAMRKICAVLCFGIGVAFTLGALYSLLTESLFKVVLPGFFAAIFLLSSLFLLRRSK